MFRWVQSKPVLLLSSFEHHIKWQWSRRVRGSFRFLFNSRKVRTSFRCEAVNIWKINDIFVSLIWISRKENNTKLKWKMSYLLLGSPFSSNSSTSSRRSNKMKLRSSDEIDDSSWRIRNYFKSYIFLLRHLINLYHLMDTKRFVS